MATVYTFVTNGVVVGSLHGPQTPPGPPGYVEMDDTDPRWLAYLNPPNAAIDDQIRALEATVTARRVREATTSDAGKAWLAALDGQIAALRAQRR